MSECTYCGCQVEAHDPVYVAAGAPGAETDPYCNYGCLRAHIDEAGLAVGSTCELPGLSE